jgi:hypothetical protein
MNRLTVILSSRFVVFLSVLDGFDPLVDFQAISVISGDKVLRCIRTKCTR